MAAIDGVELLHSNLISCSTCLSRTLKSGMTEVFHKAVGCMLVGDRLNLWLGIDFLHPRDGNGKQEGELTGARRLIEFLVQQLGQFADIVVMDALYVSSGLIQLVRAKGMHVVIQLKNMTGKVAQEALRRKATMAPTVVIPKVKNRNIEKQLRIWDISVPPPGLPAPLG